MGAMLDQEDCVAKGGFAITDVEGISPSSAAYGQVGSSNDLCQCRHTNLREEETEFPEENSVGLHGVVVLFRGGLIH